MHLGVERELVRARCGSATTLGPRSARSVYVPPKNKTAKTESLEATLWAAADKLRGKMDSAVYKHVALGLIFLK